jgi:NAD(P)-dependent dehydrogenase (short-subunit alcohol dehydrogenase family)
MGGDGSVNEWGDVRPGVEAFDLSGKKALVIGVEEAAGRAIALALAEAGADVTACSAGSEGEAMFAATKVRGEITKLGRQAWASGTDVTLGTGVQVMVRQAAKEMGGIDILVNAGDAYIGKPAVETTDLEFNRIVQVCLAGTFHACRAAGKEMLKQAAGGRAGRIINVSSVLGERGLANSAAYCAAQAGVLNLTRALSQEWAGAASGASGITVNAIAQGWMEHTAAIGDPNPEANQTVRFVPMKRAGRADELGPLAVWLASDAAGYVTGQVLFVDGGLTTHL